ncbi:MAG: hypothetical protein KIT09_27355 [Bryobacteraceae bacterium]|nr:hypothetical protein [Bryobacteraceae bacterium]
MGIESASIAEFLPDIELPATLGGTPVQVRGSGGKTSVLFAIHGVRCGDCQEYIDQLARIAGGFEVWDAQLLVLAPAPLEEAARLRSFGTILADEDGRLAASGSAAVIVADRYGQIFHAASCGASHNLPSAREIEEWLKYLGTLCPE